MVSVFPVVCDGEGNSEKLVAVVISVFLSVCVEEGTISVVDMLVDGKGLAVAVTPAVLCSSSLVLGITITEDTSATAHHIRKRRARSMRLAYDILLVVKLYTSLSVTPARFSALTLK